MKLFKKIFLVLSLSFVGLIALASCSNVSNSYCRKINDAAHDSENISVEDAKAALGDECLDFTSKEILAGNGALIGIKGMTKDNYLEKITNADPHDEFEVIMITVAGNKCVGATYQTMSLSQIKSYLKIKD